MLEFLECNFDNFLSLPSPPFEYSVRVSNRARYVRLAFKPYRGLEVVIPKRFPKKQIPRILQQHHVWITEQLKKQQQRQPSLVLPDTIMLNMNGQSYSVEYEQTGRNKLDQKSNHLLLQAESEQQALLCLRAWVRKQAAMLLIPLLEQLSQEFGLRYNRVSIRSQKSRWGSYSNRGTISLNDQLIFMPFETVRYLLIHELCHSRHMNHSADYWRLVESCCPDYRKHDADLGQARELVPEWFRYSLYN